MYKMNRNDELDGSALLDFIKQHEVDKKKYTKLKEQYMSRPDILKHEKKENNKPDNRLVVNFSRYLVNTYNGYFIGIPTKVYHDEEEVNTNLQLFWKQNDMDDVLSELGKLTSLYGRGYLFVYQDEDANTSVAYNDPFDMFVIYTKTIRPSSLYGVRYSMNEDGTYSGQIYEDSHWYNFVLDGDELVTETATDESGNSTNSLYYGRVPIIEFIENEERQSLIEPVESLINAYDKAISEKANDVDYFSDAYLAILGAELDEASIRTLRDNRIINLKDNVASSKIIVEFLHKPDGDQTQENLLDRVERLIYTISMITNLQDSTGTATPASGESLKIKQQPMANMARVKERKFQSGLQTLFGMYFKLPTNILPQHRDEYINVEYTWTRNTPNIIKDEVDIAKGLEGITSRKTQLAQLSVVADVDAEIDKINEESNTTVEIRH